MAFQLYDLRVEVVVPDGDTRRILCGAKPGDYFEVKGEMISFPENQAFSMYSLGAVLPLLAAKQRCRDGNDWMWTDALVSCPDPNCPTKLKIIRTGIREFQHDDTTADWARTAQKFASAQISETKSTRMSSSEASKQKLWGGRFTGGIDPLMWEFNQSLKYDKRMHAEDIQGSIAYAKALRRANVISNQEEQQLVAGLKQVGEEWQSGTFAIKSEDEDIHTANERRLKELIGAVGGKLHTGRSRNDQVATDMRLWLLNEVKDLETSLKEFLTVIVERANAEKAHILPGYTHLQRALPVRWSHFLLSHAFAFNSDLERLRQLIPRISILPLGCGALAGNPFLVDREFLAKELGFISVAENSLWGVSDRDFVVEFMMWGSLLCTHLSRLSEDLIVYSTAEFGFIALSDAYSTGSSMMPQKKNPDSLELLRGKAGRVFGDLAGFMMSLKGLPSTYNKDLQEDKEALFDAADTVSACLKIATGVIASLNIHPEKMRSALTMDMLATDLADYLVRKGMPFRDTHHVSGRAVALAESKKCQISELSLSELQSLSSLFTKDVNTVFDFESSVEKRNAIGGTSIQMVERQVQVLRKALNV